MFTEMLLPAHNARLIGLLLGVGPWGNFDMKQPLDGPSAAADHCSSLLVGTDDARIRNSSLR